MPENLQDGDDDDGILLWPNNIQLSTGEPFEIRVQS